MNKGWVGGAADESDLRSHRCGRRAGGGRARGRGGLRLRVALVAREDGDRDERDGCRDRGVDASAAALALPRFLDQRLDESFEFVAVDRIVGPWRAGWCGYAHAVSVARLRYCY